MYYGHQGIETVPWSLGKASKPSAGIWSIWRFVQALLIISHNICSTVKCFNSHCFYSQEQTSSPTTETNPLETSRASPWGTLHFPHKIGSNSCVRSELHSYHQDWTLIWIQEDSGFFFLKNAALPMHKTKKSTLSMCASNLLSYLTSIDPKTQLKVVNFNLWVISQFSGVADGCI